MCPRNLLQRAVDGACKTVSTCVVTDSYDLLGAKIAAKSACIAARGVINRVCFGGGDDGHKQAIADGKSGVGDCLKVMATKAYQAFR